MNFRPHLLIILIFLLCTVTCFAIPTVQIGVEPKWILKITPSGKQPGIREVNDGYYLKLYEEQNNAITDEEYVHIIRDIVSEAGVQQASDVSINFNPSYEKLTIHYVKIWRNGLLINKLSKNAIKVIASEQDLQKFIYNGYYTAYLILDDIRKGDQIEYAYTTTGSNPIIPKKFYSFVFQGSDVIGTLHYRLILPNSPTFNFRYFNLAAQPIATKNANETIYEWKIDNIKPMLYPDHLPSWFYPYPYVQISEYKNWQEVAQWGNQINNATAHFSGSLKDRITQLKATFNADSAKLFRQCVDIVQNEIRYMGVEIGAHSHKAHDPEKVYEQRYGDCKDKSLLLVSMLRSMGFNAEVALVNTANKEKTAEQLPGPYAFNHAIVLAHFSNKEIWVDPTIDNQGGSDLDIYCPAYGKALVLSNETIFLKDIPKRDNGETRYTENYVVYSDSLPTLFTVFTEFKGCKADNVRREFANESKVDLEKGYLEYYTKIYPKIEAIDTIIITDDRSKNIVTSYEAYSISNFMEYVPEKNQYQTDLYASMIKNLLPSVENNKEFPIGLTYPTNMYYDIHVTSKVNWDIKQKSEKIDRDAYAFSYTIWAKDSILNLSYHLLFKADHITPSDIAQYERDRKKIVEEYLSYSFYISSNNATKQTINYWTILVLIILLGSSIYGAYKIYYWPTFSNEEYYSKTISGWLVLPGIALLWRLAKKIYLMFDAGFFSDALWTAFDNRTLASTYKALLWFEYIGNIMSIFLIIFCLLLYIKRRDILPKYMVILYVGSFAFVLLDTLFVVVFSISDKFDFKDAFQVFVGACIWVPYFLYANQVKETFTVPAPKKKE